MLVTRRKKEVIEVSITVLFVLRVVSLCTFFITGHSIRRGRD